MKIYFISKKIIDRNTASTVNCSHHLCEICANEQMREYSKCVICNGSYTKKDIRQNKVLCNVINTFHEIQAQIDKVKQLEIDWVNAKSGKETKINKRNNDSNMDDSDDDSDDMKCEPIEAAVTGFDKSEIQELMELGEPLNLKITKKWSAVSTKIVIANCNMNSLKPDMSFKIYASILARMPILHKDILYKSTDKYYSIDNIKDEYYCKYRKMGINNLFDGYHMLLVNTGFSDVKLKGLCELGGAVVYLRNETKRFEELNGIQRNKKITIMNNGVESYTAKKLSDKFNSLVLHETWILHSIYSDDVISDLIDKPINNVIDWMDYDATHSSDDEDSDL